jgi:hypothetical protein
MCIMATPLPLSSSAIYLDVSVISGPELKAVWKVYG